MTQPAAGPKFMTTRWSLVQRAGAPGSAAPRALAELLALYERPIRAQLRRWRVAGADPDDLYQGFITRLLEDDALARADPGRGTFRGFLSTALERFGSNQVRAQQARKRGGDVRRDDDIDLAGVVADAPLPDAQFDADWAQTVLERATAALRLEAESRGKGALFDALAPYLAEDAARDDYLGIAERFGVTANAIGVAVHRLRARWRELVRGEVLDTVDDPDVLARELAHLREALRG